MTLKEKIKLVAAWLRREARRRKNRGKLKVAGIDFVERDDEVFAHPRQASELPPERRGERYAAVSIYPRKAWLLLELIPKGPAHAVPIIVHFGYRRKLDVSGKSENEKGAKRKEIRAALWRARREGKLHSHALCVNERMSPRQIVEQLSIVLAQEEVFDESTLRGLGLRSSSPVTQTVGSHLVQNFIDPAHPASYAAYKKKLWLNVAGPEQAVSALGAEEDAVSVERITDIEIRKKIRLAARKQTVGREDYSIRRAAEMLGIPWRTLYQRVEDGKLSVQHDEWGRIRLRTSEFQKLRQEEAKRQTRRDLAQFLAERHRISVASARRRIKRALKKGKTLKEIFTEAKGIRRED